MSDVVKDYVDALESLIMGFSQATRVVLRKNNLTAVQFLVLQWASTESPASMAELADFLGVRPQSVTPVVASLVSRGWIRRRRGSNDRRQTILELSPEALRLMAGYRSAHVRRLTRVLQRLPDVSLRHATEALRVSESALADSLQSSSMNPHAHPRNPRRSLSCGIRDARDE